MKGDHKEQGEGSPVKDLPLSLCPILCARTGTNIDIDEDWVNPLSILEQIDRLVYDIFASERNQI